MLLCVYVCARTHVYVVCVLLVCALVCVCEREGQEYVYVRACVRVRACACVYGRAPPLGTSLLARSPWYRTSPFGTATSLSLI